MSKWLIISGILMNSLSGVPGLLFGRPLKDAGQKLSVVMAVTGSLLGISGAILSLYFPAASDGLIRIDAITVVFILPIFLVSALGGIYGLDYWRQSEHSGNGRKLRLFYGLVTAALATITLAANSILFLVSWEIMAMSAFFLVTTEDNDRSVRDAGWVYLICTHFSTLCLFAMFALLRTETGSYELAAIPDGMMQPVIITAIFVLALTAFGCKAGIMPLHVWLPGAHASAPSHVSALMSGVLIKIGIYGLVRILSLLPSPPLWWGGTLLVLGAGSGVLGVILALAQHDLKRLLAYHSIENIGIIVMGLGLALVGRTLNSGPLIVLGLAGALLHVWNHGLFKSLLFLSAGSVIHNTHVRDIDCMGGLFRMMPRTAVCFAIGAIAICGLPPMNGFVSELFIYIGSFGAFGQGQISENAGAVFVVPVLALIGALALACFVKAFGSVFLGISRSGHVKDVHESGKNMTIPMFVLAGICMVIGTVPMIVAPFMDKAVGDWAPGGSLVIPPLLSLVPLHWISFGSFLLLALLVCGWVILKMQITRQGLATAPTWACGYAAPSSRMQYTASSLVQMLGVMFRGVQQSKVHSPGNLAVFARRSSFRTHVLDLVLDVIIRPGFRFASKITSVRKVIQTGSVQAYIFYIILFLIILLLWI